MIDWKTMSPTEAIFTHIDDMPPNTERNFATDRMNAWCLETKRETETIQLDRGHVSFIIKNRGIEQHRLDALREQDLEIPLLFCDWPNHEWQILVDGHHRYVMRARLGKIMTRVWRLQPHEWEPFLIDFSDIQANPTDPERLKKSFSGIVR